MSKNINQKPNTNLLQARLRSQLAQKTTAFLLGQSSTGSISRFETGEKLPSLPIALKLQILYKVPLQMLFYDQYQSALWQLRERGTKLHAALPQGSQDFINLQQQLNEESYCHFSELLKAPPLPPAQRERIRRHMVELSTTLSREYTIGQS